jgi:hypothetical protein
MCRDECPLYIVMEMTGSIQNGIHTSSPGRKFNLAMRSWKVDAKRLCRMDFVVYCEGITGSVPGGIHGIADWME